LSGYLQKSDIFKDGDGTKNIQMAQKIRSDLNPPNVESSNIFIGTKPYENSEYYSGFNIGIGFNSTVQSYNNIVIGHNSYAVSDEEGSIVIRNNSDAVGDIYGSVVIGNNIRRESETHPYIRIGNEEIWAIFLGKLEIDVDVNSNRLFFRTEGKYAILNLT
jgi:hypothetical protein